ncbi:EcoKI restriction-modification system protein HsdS [Streptococcus cristatus]|uniref:EcoKI restriction-modification system protein HsdS n=1 Tax=Streptococcus cristatus TaxID=45634 RepID=A0A3R9I9E2_STRCR|nr:EcoKI restriction-modification system protein HsdS [Streptococcus cristatus]
MNNWKKVKLSDIIEFNPRETLSKGAIAKKIAMEKLEPFTRDIPEFEYLEFRGGTKFRNGDTLMARITPSLENGKTSKVNLLDEDEVGFGSTEFIVVRAKENISDENFVYYLMIAPNIREVAIKSMVGTSGRQRVQLDVVKNHEILCPPLKEQIRIGKILKALDDKIENNKKINHHLAAISKNYLKIFYSSNSIKLGDIFELKSGYAFKSKDWVDEGKPVIKIKDIDGITVDITNLNYVKNKSQLSKASNFEVFGKEIVMALTGATTGKIGVIPKNFKGYVNQRVGLFYAKTELSYAVLWSILQQQNIITDLIKLSSGSAQANLSPFSVNSYDLNVTFKDLIELDKVLSPLYELFCFNLSEIQRLSKLRDTLLPKLLSGELSVNQAIK